MRLDMGLDNTSSRDMVLDMGSGINIGIEVLIPDFQGKISSLKTVLQSEPNVLAHNLETVARLYAQVRPQANYQLSLDVLRQVKE